MREGTYWFAWKDEEAEEEACEQGESGEDGEESNHGESRQYIIDNFMV